MSSVYEAIGRAVVGYVRRRYRTEIRAGLLVALASLVLGAWLLSRGEVEEG